ncbi:ABC transporter ATP-binding protein [Paracoccus aestuarii]|uniref:ABC transporter ATP-binding protein n=1 Tax=Paracoccus aestuarii TaxID=453842 RepID=A0A418ZZB9_9RHOB|nr:ABC transporter ATP-binding protein [Paracoccus aestuarii]RJL05801.1 ABC transporter ATP-binding protein [Paracoccus aestuarii]WCR01036.1 ABC transporter ATP-binding protein [Paracoccus aestuarii]
MSTPILEAVGLDVSFGEEDDRHHVVKDVGFRIGRGECYGLIGESGCGKSTVLRAAAGLNPDYEGAILLDGREQPKARRGADFLRRVQMVFQDPYASLHPRKMIDKVLREPLQIHGFDRRRQRIDEVLVQVGLDPAFRYRYPHELSGGQRQRVAIARALIMEPEVLLLDEPTSALDVSVQAEILNLLVQIQRDRGLTYLLVSHDMAVIAHVCQRIGMMQHGAIIEELTSDAVRKGRAEHPYTRQFLDASASFAAALEGDAA